MKLPRNGSGGETQSGENRVGRGPFRLATDPVLDERQSLGGLMDVVAVGDVGERLEQLLEAIGAAADGRVRRQTGSASRDARDRPQLVEFFHPVAFPPASLPKSPVPAVRPRIHHVA
jgi:hypothetical protein